MEVDDREIGRGIPWEHGVLMRKRRCGDSEGRDDGRKDDRELHDGLLSNVGAGRFKEQLECVWCGSLNASESSASFISLFARIKKPLHPSLAF